MIKPFNNAITPEQSRRAVLEIATRQDFEAVIELRGHQALTDITRQLQAMAFDGEGLPNFAELQGDEMQHALILLRVCSVALGEIERAAHKGLETLRDYSQSELDQLNALKFEFISIVAV